MKKKQCDVILINMPFDYFSWPSIGLSLLKNSIKEKISCNIRYFSLDFSEKICSPELNNMIANNYPSAMCLLGEWIFSSSEPEKDTYIKDVLLGGLGEYKNISVPGDIINEIISVKNKVNDFLEYCVTEIMDCKPYIIGFSSNYGQQLSSLSLAEKIKKQLPETFILFGGCNCEGIMGTEIIKNFPSVDAVVSGEGDIIFPCIVQRVLSGKSIADLYGVYTKENVEKISYGNIPPVKDMDSLPCPDYEDFFEQWNRSSLSKKADIINNKFYRPVIHFETSRGCWWGEKKRCTFCGYGQDIHFRSKSSGRALEEFSYLTEKYPECLVVHVDNIVDMKYFKDFLPYIKSNKLLLHHVKANVTKEQLQLVSARLQKHLQPGIESLSTSVLKLMRKGVTFLQNIQFLKWAREFNIDVHWNLLWGFPGESSEDYRIMSELIPLLSHLEPPKDYGSIYVSRFSPYFDNPEDFGFSELIPYGAYRYIYPALTEEAIKNIAFFFTFNYKIPQDPEEYTKPVKEAIEKWIHVYPESSLIYMDYRKHLIISDRRSGAKEEITIISGLERLLYLACDSIKSISELKNISEKYRGKKYSEEEILEIINPLSDRGFIRGEDNKYLALAIKFKE
ncbi:MAG: RiPP maturation radical SAM C-methyltransferase [Candidatus Eremiobacterota bacterium]